MSEVKRTMREHFTEGNATAGGYREVGSGKCKPDLEGRKAERGGKEEGKGPGIRSRAQCGQ